MSVRKWLQLGEKILYGAATTALVVGMSTSSAAAPTPKPLTPDQQQQLCGIGLEATTGVEYIDTLTSVLFQNQADEFALSTFSAFNSDSGDTPGLNIYMGAYNKVAREPTQNAIERTANATGLTKAAALSVLNGSVDVLRNSGGGILTHEEAVRQAENFKQFYNEQIKLTQLEAELHGHISSYEIFSDGDLGNSGGFDLLSDLDRIDYLLFFDQAKVSTGADLDSLINPSPTPSPAASASPSPSPASSPASKPTPTPTSSAAPAASPTSSPASAAGSAIANYIPDPKDNRLQCFADTGLNAQIEASLKKDLPETEEEKHQKRIDASTKENVQDALGSGDDVFYPDDGTITSEPTDAEQDKAANKPENVLCNDWICFEVITNIKQQSLFTDSANCIACHVEKSRENLEKVTSKNLVPNKLTGNLFEAAKCKNPAAQVGFPINIVTIFNPIQTPPNTNRVGTEWLVSFDKVLQTTLGGDYYDPKKDEYVSKMAHIQSQVIKSLPSDASAAEAERQIAAAVTKAQNEAARAAKAALDENIAFGKGDFYTQVSSQIGYMDAYFKAMQKSYTDISEVVCPSIQNKPACS